MPLQATSGAASQDAFGGNGVAVVPNYIEDVFSTYLYTGNGSNRSISNGIDLSTKGGMTWFKGRNVALNNLLFDTARGVGKFLRSDTTNAETTASDTLTAFNTDGFSLGVDSNDWGTNFSSTRNFASWTFRKQPKFFDIVTWTGNGSSPRAISHSLGSTPGCIIVKAYSSGGAGENWTVYHRRLNGGTTPQNYGIYLNLTNAEFAESGFWSNTAPTSTQFTVGGNLNSGFGGGVSYIAYIFAHDAGGFGLTGTDNVISCGSFTTDGSGNATVTLGYEPQWLMFKASTTTQDWYILDSMRGMTSGGAEQTLRPNTSGAEDNFWNASFKPTATGFSVNAFNSSTTYIYIAIRRGPMKVPTTGTSVYNAIARTGTGAVAQVTGVGFPPDLMMPCLRASGGAATYDRLRGPNNVLATAETTAERTFTGTVTSYNMDGVTLGSDTSNYYVNYSGATIINWFFRRAPSFFDEVCYTGTGSSRTVAHNLGVAPELMILKVRGSITDSWQVYCSALDVSGGDYLLLNDSAAKQTNGSTRFTGAPTSTLINLSTNGSVNGSGNTYVAYLFATCAGVSKVFSYTGNGSSQTINCGFTAGARFVLIKRTNSTGDWYVWDTVRGIVAGNDPHLSLNTTAAEVTSNDTIDTDNTGFVVNQVTATNVNVSSATYIGLAIA